MLPTRLKNTEICMHHCSNVVLLTGKQYKLLLSNVYACFNQLYNITGTYFKFNKKNCFAIG
jgi:hypothetical protein